MFKNGRTIKLLTISLRVGLKDLTSWGSNDPENSEEDGDPKHKARKKQIKFMKWPTQCPDLNPIKTCGGSCQVTDITALEICAEEWAKVLTKLNLVKSNRDM